MLRRRIFYCTAILALLAGICTVFWGCSESDDDNPASPAPPTGSNSSTIPPGGGTVSYENASVIIPAGALDDSTIISVGIPDNAPSYNQPANTAQIGYVYEFGPAGQSFNTPVTIAFEYEDAQLGSYSPSNLKIMTYSSAGSTPIQLENIHVNTATKMVTGETNHFSYFVLIVSTSGGGGGEIPQEPQGGNPIGEWIFDYLTVPEIQSDTLRLSITGTGEGTLTYTQSEFMSDLTLYMHTHTEIYNSFLGTWIITDVQDTTYENISGTYIVEGVELISTITGSTTNPEYIGDVRTVGFTAEADRLILYQMGSLTTGYDMYVVYRR